MSKDFRPWKIDEAQLLPPSVQDFAPWVPPEIAHIVHRALQRDRNLRYPNADAMLTDLRALLMHGSSIDESMLVAVPEEHRLCVQQRAPRGLADAASSSSLSGRMPIGSNSGSWR